jgi:hypothetical protein
MQVEQCDRVAAASYMKVISDNRWSQSGILGGGCDNTTVVLAFAAHRIAERERCAGIVELSLMSEQGDDIVKIIRN